MRSKQQLLCQNVIVIIVSRGACTCSLVLFLIVLRRKKTEFFVAGKDHIASTTAKLLETGDCGDMLIMLQS